MRILFVGDIMGRSGREALEKYLPQLRKDLEVDVTIVNGENAAHGRGITEKFCQQFYEAGADIITTGNHVWDQREILKYITRDPKLLRPANFPQKTTPGNGFYVHELMDGRKILVVNMMCRLFMETLDDPFQVMEDILQDHKMGKNCDAIFVDLHGEATSEKMAFGHHFSGRISAVIGTHTHIPTADAHVMVGGTAYMTDAGMTGDYDSVIGIQKEAAISRFTRKTPGEHFIPANNNMTLCGALVITNDHTGKATAIKSVRIGDILENALPRDT
ncbi:MAG: TIGR00282 family metallophosphoesterase [Alphaproteobacteria bacterium]|nr:TIGR00282 family metallophosphoesterase [Alphaproteobacteria bacterium]